ncbi:hypothetical protein BCR41DRAFT_199263 [Lobosporangium transversale]|uniref:Uncharacterized protein n=1 Tax=Lobosporangium transversale TaxID=64571 RepID=A0A1Y2G8M3_9FUNG|nr:hypothetical protein BCR41DRAFT_199263 [Lobosporangium transversale]ORZ04314.1 hypothetical protein BCR41DRAFT_199263 [Lobosporangium transversale]|eukprot:XP_021876472.1 hypothetical protein BCR41DRAFT_199263 [Lobosporangium transversale]
MANQCLNQELFTVSKSQEAIFQGLKLELGHGAIEDLRAMRRYCKRRYCDLEEERDHGAWPASEKDARNEELKIVLIMELLANEIIAMQNVPKASEHEDVFIWRGLARILYDYDLVVRVGELGSSATREDRAAMEQEFGGTDSNVRSKKIDLMHQLCLQGVGKPIELIAWEVKSSSVSPDILQIQLRKNIRTNASIMNNISQYMERTFPRPSPIILDIVGSKALAYTVRKFEPGAFGAGAVGDTMIQIPRHADEIPEFLDGGGLSALLRIGVS